MGLEKAKKGKYDVIVLDLKLPKMYGGSVLDALRALGDATPILVMSSINTPEEIARILNHGADGYLNKPIVEKVFIANLKVLLRRKMSQRKNVIRCNNVIVNLDNYSVFRSGKHIPLAKKEFGILLELVKNKNQVQSRKDLFQKVWGESDAPVNSNTIDVHIRMLRDKIDKPFPGSPLIETIRGFGYIIKEMS
jgi:DNA-binding response OmpR family regulator